jgi:predicted phosphodiesterase
MSLGPVLYCGDPHGEFRHIVKAARELRASAVVLLGDMEPRRPLHEELEAIADKVWFIHGNHDTDSDELRRRVWEENRLADRNIGGRVVTLPDDTRLAGLGGVFREAVWYPTESSARAGVPAFRNRADHARATPPQERWREGPRRKHISTIYPDEFDRLAKLQADILVTHEAPGYHPNGFDLLDDLARAMGVKVLVHGHQRDWLDSSGCSQAQGYRRFGVGPRGITAADRDGNASVVVPGHIDIERSARQKRMIVATEKRSSGASQDRDDPANFDARGEAAWEESQRTGVSYSLEEVLKKLAAKWQPKLHARLQGELQQLKSRGEAALQALAYAQRKASLDRTDADGMPTKKDPPGSQ